MLKYFLESKEISQVNTICQLLNLLKQRIEQGDYNDSFREYEEAKQQFIELKDIAVKIKDEKLANSNFVFKEYFCLFCNLGQYFYMLKNKEYRNSWNKLQDCLDIAKFVGRFVDFPNRLEVPSLVNLLISYEKLYPYKFFASTEFVIKKAHCSICGKSVLGLDCPHVRGNLYWGKQAVEVVDEIETFQAVALVENPEDKRCILEPKDDSLTDDVKFKKLDLFMALDRSFLQNFSIKEEIETRRDYDIKKVGRNEKCPCGSGKKFKKCCLDKMYYKHQHNIVTPLDFVEFVYF